MKKNEIKKTLAHQPPIRYGRIIRRSPMNQSVNTVQRLRYVDDGLCWA